MKAYRPELRERAIALRKQGWGHVRIARELGCGETTARRWIDPAYNEDHLRKSRERKKGYRGTCLDCGAPTSYSGKGTSGSDRCASCARKRVRYWTRERIIAAIQRWAREHEGRPPTATEWIKRGPYWPAATGLYGQQNSIFRSWNHALASAGFTPRHSPPGPGRQLWSRDEAKRLRDLGWTNQQIADKYNVTPRAIYNEMGMPDWYVPRTNPGRPPKRTREQRIADLRAALAKEE